MTEYQTIKIFILHDEILNLLVVFLFLLLDVSLFSFHYKIVKQVYDKFWAIHIKIRFISPTKEID